MSEAAVATEADFVAVDGWDASGITKALMDEDYKTVMEVLSDFIDVRRDPRAVNWCVEYGYRRGHVPVLWHLSRNLLRYSKGKVPTCEELAFGIRCGFLLLLRVAQDITSCKVDLAKPDRDFIYTEIASEVGKWILRWNAAVLPPSSKVAEELDAWLQSTSDVTLPLPTWATNFGYGIFMWHWNSPESHDVAAFKRCAKLNETRNTAAALFVNLLRTKFSNVLKLDSVSRVLSLPVTC